MNLIFERKPTYRLNGPVMPDRSPSFGQGMTALYTFSSKKTSTTIRNFATRGNNLTLQAGATLGVDKAGRCYKGIAATNSYATTGAAPTLLGISGAGRRTIFCKFKSNAASSGGNLGGLFSVGDFSGTNTFLSIRQVSDSPSDNGPDQWCVDTGTNRLYFTVPGTANAVHDIVMTFDGNSIQIYVDGNQVGQFRSALTTTSSINLDVGRWYNPTSDVSINYFNGSIFTFGVVAYDWNSREVRNWHVNPGVLLTRRATVMPPSPFNVVPVITLSGLGPSGAIGALAASLQNANVVMSGLPVSSGIGIPFVALSSGVSFVQLTGLAPANVIGALIVARQGGFWTPVAPFTNAWSSTPAPSGG